MAAWGHRGHHQGGITPVSGAIGRTILITSPLRTRPGIDLVESASRSASDPRVRADGTSRHRTSFFKDDHRRPSGVKHILHLGVSLAASTTNSPNEMSRSYSSGLSKAFLTQAGQIRPARCPDFLDSSRRKFNSSRETRFLRWHPRVTHLTGCFTDSTHHSRRRAVGARPTGLHAESYHQGVGSPPTVPRRRPPPARVPVAGNDARPCTGRAGGPGVAVSVIRTVGNPELRRGLNPDTLHPCPQLASPGGQRRDRRCVQVRGDTFRLGQGLYRLPGRPATGRVRGFTDCGHDPEQRDAVPLMAKSSGGTRVLPDRCAAARTWPTHRTAPPGPSIYTDLFPAAQTGAFIEVEALNVRDEQLQEFGSPGHGLGLVGTHRVNDVPNTHQAIPGGVVDGLVALGCLPADHFCQRSHSGSLTAGWSPLHARPWWPRGRGIRARTRSRPVSCRQRNLMDNKCWGCRYSAQGVDSTIGHLRVTGIVLVVIDIYLFYYYDSRQFQLP